jgi:hypothetical protein
MSSSILTLPFDLSTLEQVFCLMARAAEQTSGAFSSAAAADQVFKSSVLSQTQKDYNLDELNDKIKVILNGFDQIDLQIGQNQKTMDSWLGWMENLKGVEDSLNFVLGHLDYIDTNKETLSHFLQNFDISTSNRGKEKFETVARWANAAAGLAFNYTKSHYIPGLQKDLKKFKEKSLLLQDLQNKCQELQHQYAGTRVAVNNSIFTKMNEIQPKIDDVQKQILSLEDLLMKEQKKAQDELNPKNIYKLGSHLVSCIIPAICTLTQKIVNKVTKLGYTLYKDAQDLKEIDRLKQKQNEWVSHLTEVSAPVDYASSLLKQRQAKASFEERVDFFLEEKLAQHAAKCKKLPFDEINKYVATHLHVDFAQLMLVPQNEEEWIKCLSNNIFCRSVAEQYVQHQDTVAILFKQGMHQALLSKNRVEAEFLNFKAYAHLISIVSSVAQFALLLPIIGSGMFPFLLKVFFFELTKLGLVHFGLIYLFYPDIKLKLEALLAVICEHCFAIRHKPNEYNVESYKIHLKMRLFQIIAYVFDVIYAFKHVFIWSFVHLFENRMKTNDAIYQGNRSLAQLNEEWKLSRQFCKDHIDLLAQELKGFRTDDAALIFDPHSLQKTQQKDVFDGIQEAMKEIDTDLFPKETKQWLLNHLNINLSENSKKDLKKHLITVFSQNAKNFINNGFRSV